MPHASPRRFAVPAGALALALTVVTLAAPASSRAQDVMTDYPDYYPGDVVVMTGAGWWPGERISLRLDQHPTLHDPYVFYATADSTGAFRNSDYVIQDQDLGTSFDLTATGLSSGLTATTFFTDSPKVGSVSVGAQTGTLCGGSSSSATYEVTVTRGSGGGSSGSFTARLNLGGDPRPGITASFSPLILSFSPGQTSRTAIMTIHTDSSTPTGSWGFNVMASTSQNDFAYGTGLMEVGGKPTVTCPADITVPNEPGKAGAAVTFAGSAQGTPTPFLTYSDEPGSFFPVGTTTVDVSSTNPCGAVGCQFNVTVLDVEPPTITVSDITTPAGPGVCTAYVALLGATVHDNCPGASLTGVRSDGAPLPAAFPGGVTTITWTATDAHGNTATATQHVTVNDTEKPTITAPAALNLATGTGATACGLTISNAALGTATAHDNCGVTVERTGVPAGNLFPVGTTTITYTATDPSGNSATGTQAVTVADDTPPSIATSPLAVDTDPGACGARIAHLGTTAADNCGVATLDGIRSDGAALGAEFPAGTTTITWTATDIHGNTATATQTIEVADHQQPSITEGDLTRSTDPGACSATIASLGVDATDNCAIASLVGTRGDGLPLADPFPKGSTTITWVATDVHGNTATATQHVTVNDTERPTITAPAALNLTTGAGATACGLTVSDAALGTAHASDNCGVTVERTGMPAGNLFPVGTTTITYTATDPSGNTAVATQSVIVADDTPPSITVENLARDTDPGACSAGIASLGATASDNCGIASLTGTRSDAVALSDPFPKGTTTITWLATDIHGNTANATQTVTVTDRERPKVTATDFAVSTDPGSCAATIASLGAAATDNCGTPTLSGTRSDGSPLTDPFPKGLTTIEWLATDASLNTAGATQHVTVSDTEHPTLTAPASLNLTTGPNSQTCGVTVGAAALGTPVAHDNCGVTVTAEGIPAGNLFPVGTTTITYTASDPSGNTATATQTVTVVDDTPPTMSMRVSVHNTDPGICGARINSFAGDKPTDNCGIAGVVGTRSDGLALSDPFPVGLTTITWVATDVHGNTGTGAEQIHVEDHEAPSIAAPAAVQAATGSGARICGAVISDQTLGKPVVSDNCSFTLTRTGVPAGNLFPTGPTTITWTATDPSGNTSSATQTVTVTDNTPPTLTVPPAVTLGTGADATTCGRVVPDAALGAATASDNCSVTLTRAGVPAENLFPTGVTTITYTATDPSGNTVSATQLVMITDTTPPKVTAADLTRPTDAGTCAATIAALGAAATDNCGTPVLAGARADGKALSDPFPKGSTTILWTATDAAGNTSTATQTITVTNAVPAAEITAPVSGLVVPVGTPVSFTGNFSDDSGDAHTASWSCDATTFAATVDEGARTVAGSMTFAAAGVYRVCLTVTDQCGSAATANQVGGLDAMVVVYDPSAGFVTGGGWIQSPAGAYAADPSLTGKANFGFVSKYKKGATVPTGDTEFQFKAGGLDFHSSSYDWLVISGARAQYKGMGTVNGVGSYGFLLSAVDGDVSGGGGKDKFRIKIIDKASGLLVYDNMMGAADTAAAATVLGGGSIQIQTNGGNKAGASIGATLDAFASSTAPAANGLAQNRPNPFNPETSIRFSMARAGYASLRVYDVRGALVRTLVDAALPEGAHEARWNGLDERGGRVPTGVYYALFETAGYRDRIRMVLIK